MGKPAETSGLEQIYALWQQVRAAGMWHTGDWYMSQDAFQKMLELPETVVGYTITPVYITTLFGRDVFEDKSLGRGVIEYRCDDATFTAQLK